MPDPVVPMSNDATFHVHITQDGNAEHMRGRLDSEDIQNKKSETLLLLWKTFVLC